MPLFPASTPVLLRNDRRWPEDFFDLDKKARAPFRVEELDVSQVLGFNIGKDARLPELITIRSGVMRVVLIGLGKNIGGIYDYVLDEKDTSMKIFSPSGWALGMTPLTESASVNIFSHKSVKRRDLPKVLDPFDPDMRFDWSVGKVDPDVALTARPYDRIYSFQQLCQSL